MLNPGQISECATLKREIERVRAELDAIRNSLQGSIDAVSRREDELIALRTELGDTVDPKRQAQLEGLIRSMVNSNSDEKNNQRQYRQQIAEREQELADLEYERINLGCP